MRLVLAALAAAAAFAPFGAALACSCIRQSSAAEHLSATDVAFKGRVLDTRVDNDGNAVTRFRVTDTIKGLAPRTVAVAHHTVSATCGLTYRKGSTALVLAHVRAADVRTNLCSAPQFSEDEYRRAARGSAGPRPKTPRG